MTRETPYGEIADHYDANLWPQLDRKLRDARLELALRIATMNAPHDVIRYHQGALRGLDAVRSMANELMRNREDDPKET